MDNRSLSSLVESMKATASDEELRNSRETSSVGSLLHLSGTCQRMLDLVDLSSKALEHRSEHGMIVSERDALALREENEVLRKMLYLSRDWVPSTSEVLRPQTPQTPTTPFIERLTTPPRSPASRFRTAHMSPNQCATCPEDEVAQVQPEAGVADESDDIDLADTGLVVGSLGPKRSSSREK